MQSKGAIRFVAIVLAVVCLWQLAFTLVTKIQENKAAKYAEKAVANYESSAAFSKVSEADKAFYLDSIRKESNRWYLDSISSEKIYFGYTYKDVKSKEINLGLDLKGGMNVMLEISVEDVIRALSNDSPRSSQKPCLWRRNVLSHQEATTSHFSLTRGKK